MPTASAGQTGSGALPLEEIPSLAVTLSWPGHSIEGLAEGLRSHSLPVMGYVRDDRLFLDLRTVRGDEIGPMAEAIRWAVRLCLT